MRLDEFKPMLFKTTDFGETWTSIAGNLPQGKPVNVVVQDRKNPKLLFAGTDQGLYASLDGGTSWLPFKNNMPWVKVTDLVIHPRENDLVVATYGRGAWIADISPLQETDKSLLERDVHLFDIEPCTQRVYTVAGNYQLLGDSHLFTPNEPNAVIINYYLKAKAGEEAKITVTDSAGTVVAEMTGPAEPGLNAASWGMRARRTGQPRGEEGGFGRGGMVDPGEYTVKLDVAGKSLTKKAVIRYRQGWTFGAVPVIIK
jgi:hypothetical protein